jgi:hypothetical protein
VTQEYPGSVTNSLCIDPKLREAFLATQDQNVWNPLQRTVWERICSNGYASLGSVADAINKETGIPLLTGETIQNWTSPSRVRPEAKATSNLGGLSARYESWGIVEGFGNGEGRNNRSLVLGSCLDTLDEVRKKYTFVPGAHTNATPRMIPLLSDSLGVSSQVVSDFLSANHALLVSLAIKYPEYYRCRDIEIDIKTVQSRIINAYRSIGLRRATETASVTDAGVRLGRDAGGHNRCLEIAGQMQQVRSIDDIVNLLKDNQIPKTWRQFIDWELLDVYRETLCGTDVLYPLEKKLLLNYAHNGDSNDGMGIWTAGQTKSLLFAYRQGRLHGKERTNQISPEP